MIHSPVAKQNIAAPWVKKSKSLLSSPKNVTCMRCLHNEKPCTALHQRGFTDTLFCRNLSFVSQPSKKNIEEAFNFDNNNSLSLQENRKGSKETTVVPALVNERVKYTTDLARLSTSNPILAFTLTVVMFSIAGIPPLAGFYSKAFLMFAAIGSANYALAIIGVAMSVVSAFYYLRIVKIMYFESVVSPGKKNKVSSAGSMLSFMQINKEISLVCAATLAFLLFFSLHPKPIFLLTQKAALLVS